MNRLTPDLIRKYNPTLSTLAITLVLVDERKLRFEARATVFAQNIADPVNGAPESQTIEIANSDGKVRTWPDVDTLIRSLGKALPALVSSSFSITMEKLVTTYPVTYTPSQIAAKQHASLTKAIPAQLNRVNLASAAVNAVASFELGTPSQRGVWQEAKDKHSLATAQQAFMGSELARLALLFTPTVL